MSELDDYETTRVIHQQEETWGIPRAPTVVPSASVLPEERHIYLEAGMDDFLVKPVRQASRDTADAGTLARVRV